ncbi:MAG: 4-(cytidine 5'-diphospho)-2-C-methyl-D-erythritol kinase, partial [Terriglobales bacterium]
MPVTVRSFAKINLGLAIGPRREDGFHELRTVYQTIALHDVVKVGAERGAGIEIRCSDPRVPTGESNTCWRMAEAVLRALKIQRKVSIHIEKRLPVQGGLAGASSNAVAVLLGLERVLRRRIPMAKKLKLAAAVGSDLPLFLIGGTVMGTGRGEKVVEAPDLPPISCVVVIPQSGISTPAAFAAWDKMAAPSGLSTGLTGPAASDRIRVFSRMLRRWLRGTTSGVPGATARDRAEALLLDLVRTGIENDF